MTIAPLTGTDTVSYVEDTIGNKATAQIVVNVNPDGTPMAGGTASSPAVAGGEYTTPTPTLTNGQTDALQLDPSGSLRVRILGSTSVGSDGFSNSLTFAGSTTSQTTTALLANSGFVFNGTTWDRQRGDASGTFVKSNPLAGTDRSITATTTSAQLMAANATRSKFFIKNDTAIVIWINMGATAVAAAGSGNIAIAANGGYFEFTGYSGVVNIIAASTTAAVTAREF